ncbi:hypothetical protein Tco_0325599, partial [Tanacetum coccineum]
MIACVEKTAQNADFYQIIDFLTGCSINYSLLVDPDLIGLWLQQFWATASTILSEEHYVQEEDTADPFFDNIADKDAAVTPFFDNIADKDAAVTPDLERKSDETEE